MKPRDDALIHPACSFSGNSDAANEENRSAEEIPREAIECCLRNRRWQQLFAYGEERACELGLTEAHIPHLIAESRREVRKSTK